LIGQPHQVLAIELAAHFPGGDHHRAGYRFDPVEIEGPVAGHPQGSVFAEEHRVTGRQTDFGSSRVGSDDRMIRNCRSGIALGSWLVIDVDGALDMNCGPDLRWSAKSQEQKKAD